MGLPSRSLLFFISISPMVLGTRATSVCNGSLYGIACYDGKDLDTVPAGIPSSTLFLRLEHNKLTRLPADVFSGLSQLVQLTLHNNLITEIENGAFSGLVGLKKLDLESNNINLLTKQTFQGVPNLEVLSLSNNRLLSLGNGVFNQIPNLLELDVSHNGIREFPAEVAKYLPNVKVLDLSSNPAQLLLIQNTVGIFKHMVALQHLKLNELSEVSNTAREIRIPECTFDGLPNLTNLELNGNRLSKIPSAIKSLKNLKYISLRMNSIQSVGANDFHQPSPLEILLLDKNKLVEIPASALAQLPHLTELYLDFNSISTIPARAFWHNPRLTNLSLAFTNLTSIHKDAFFGLDQLGPLNLQGNNLTTIEGGVMTHVNPKVKLQLSGNPLLCDCNLRGFASWLKDIHIGSLNKGKRLHCVAPDGLRETSLTDLCPNQFACKPHLTSNSDTTLSVLPGTEVSLPCPIEADPMLRIIWITRDHTLIQPDQPPFAIAENGSLSITRVDLCHEGLYTCVVSNDAGTGQYTVKLEVQQAGYALMTWLVVISVILGLIFVGFCFFCWLIKNNMDVDPVEEDSESSADDDDWDRSSSTRKDRDWRKDKECGFYLPPWERY